MVKPSRGRYYQTLIVLVLVTLIFGPGFAIALEMSTPGINRSSASKNSATSCHQRSPAAPAPGSSRP